MSSEEEAYLSAKATYSEHLANRGYSNNSITEAFQKFENTDRTSLYMGKEKEVSAQRHFPLVTEFNPHLPNVTPVLNKHKHILLLDKVTNKVIPQENVFASFSQPKNIKNLLIHSKFSSNDKNSISTTNGKCNKCNNCCLCKYFLVETNSFKSYHCTEMHHIKHELSCRTEGIIYLLNDKICKRSYIGSTIGNMRSRFSNYKNHIKIAYNGCEIAQHFASNPTIHTTTTKNSASKKDQTEYYNQLLQQQLEIIIIDKIEYSGTKLTTKEKRIEIENKEGFWQTQLHTLKRYGGLNCKDDRMNTNKRKAGASSTNLNFTPKVEDTLRSCNEVTESNTQLPLRRSTRLLKATGPLCE